MYNNYRYNQNNNRLNRGTRKFVQTKLNFGQKKTNEYVENPSLVRYDFGNIMLCQVSLENKSKNE